MYVSTLKLQPGICLKTVFALLLAASASACHCRNARTHPDKQRLIVTTDLGGTDPDDTQSMIHLLVCSNAIDIEGLVSSQVWSDMPDKVDRIREVVGQFEKVLPRLKKHAEGYPEPGYLRSVTRQGQKTSKGSYVKSASMTCWDRMMPVLGLPRTIPASYTSVTKRFTDGHLRTNGSGTIYKAINLWATIIPTGNGPRRATPRLSSTYMPTD